jgi:hypothetical protein
MLLLRVRQTAWTSHATPTGCRVQRLGPNMHRCGQTIQVGKNIDPEGTVGIISLKLATVAAGSLLEQLAHVSSTVLQGVLVIKCEHVKD